MCGYFRLKETSRNVSGYGRTVVELKTALTPRNRACGAPTRVVRGAIALMLEIPRYLHAHLPQAGQQFVESYPRG